MYSLVVAIATVRFVSSGTSGPLYDSFQNILQKAHYRSGLAYYYANFNGYVCSTSKNISDMSRLLSLSILLIILVYHPSIFYRLITEQGHGGEGGWSLSQPTLGESRVYSRQFIPSHILHIVLPLKG